MLPSLGGAGVWQWGHAPQPGRRGVWQWEEEPSDRAGLERRSPRDSTLGETTQGLTPGPGLPAGLGGWEAGAAVPLSLGS